MGGFGRCFAQESLTVDRGFAELLWELVEAEGQRRSGMAVALVVFARQSRV